jgi:hypothetical protein
VDVVVLLVVVQRTQPITQNVWPNVLVMGIVQWPLVQQSIPITNPQPTIEIALTYAYCQQVGHEFKYYPFVDNKLKQLIKK